MYRDKKSTVKMPGGHWYDRYGNSCHTVKRADGKGMRNTTLRDGRKLSLGPSVTSVIGCAAKPGLEKWKRDQVFQASQDVPRIAGEDLTSYKRRVITAADEVAAKAREKGTLVHDALEQYYSSQPVSPDCVDIVMAAADAMNEKFGNVKWTAEKAFAYVLGFGGKADLFNDDAIVDFKTKEFSDPGKVASFVYDEHGMQLSAYRRGLGIPNAKRYNVFISVQDGCEGLVAIYEWPEDDNDRHWHMFRHLLQYWQLSKKYSPDWGEGGNDE